MVRGLMGLPSGGRLLPFVRMFYGQPSVFLWEQHPILVAVNERFEPGEHLFVYLDDLCTLSQASSTYPCLFDLGPS